MQTKDEFPPVFADPHIEGVFTRDGYVVLPLFNKQEVAACRKLYFDTMTQPLDDFFTTGFLPDGEPRRRVKEGLERIIAPHVAALMPTYSTCVRHFIVKRGRPDAGPLGLHQDFNFVDHSIQRAVHVWIALADVDELNGCLTVLPGSHKLGLHISAMGLNATPYDPYRQVFEDDCKVAVPMKAGEALFFDERTLHGSCPNTSPDVRIAMGAVFLPIGVKQRLYVTDAVEAGLLDILEVESETLLNYSTVMRPPYPEGFQKIGTVEYTARPLSPEVVQSLRRVPATVPAASEIVTPPFALPEKGYTIAALLDEVDIEALSALHAKTTRNVPMGYYVSAVGSESEVRRKIFEGIVSIVEDKVEKLVPGYRILMASFVTEKAHGVRGILPIHQDYSLVDHDTHVGINIWAPLVDTHELNGQLRNIDFSPRSLHISACPANPAPSDPVCSELEAHYLSRTPMTRGQACVFDTRVLHTIEPNRTDSDRTAVILNLVPNDAVPRMYFYKPENSRQLEIYEVDAEFLLHLKPNSYPEDSVLKLATFVGMLEYDPKPWTLADLESTLSPPLPAPAGFWPSVLSFIPRLFAFASSATK